VVGRVTEPDLDESGEPIGTLRIRDGFDGEVLAEVPAASLADDAPLYDRPKAEPANRAARLANDPTEQATGVDVGDAILSLLLDPAFVYRQYDHQLFLNTVIGPGGDAALLRLAGPGLPVSNKGMALSTDSNPRWCSLDPRAGTAATVAEGMANVAVTGASAVAVVNCLNFGNPEHPEVMWQLSESIDGMGEACRALGLPVIGGNVSLYNESGGVDIDPTPVIGTLALLEELTSPPPSLAWSPGESVIVLGARSGPGSRPFGLAGSRLAVDVLGLRDGTLFEIGLAAHRQACDLVASLVATHAAGRGGIVGSIHDVGGGGLALAAAEMAVAGQVGAVLEGIDGVAEAFCERPGRFLLTSATPHLVLEAAAAAGVPAEVLGVVGGPSLVLSGLCDVEVEVLARRHASALEDALDAAG
jgi:phosphoribosylformylglycinamidine synthase